MKFFLAIFVLYTVFAAIKAKEIDAQLEEKCLKEIGMDQEAFKAALEKKVEDVDLAVKCMSRCMFKEKKMINEDGDFDVQKIASLLFTEPENVEIVKPLIESCLKGKAEETEETVETEEVEEEVEKKEGEENKEAEKKEGEEKRRKREVDEVKKEPSCEEAYDLMICVTKKIEEALKDD